VPDLRTDSAKGLLNPRGSNRPFRLRRYFASHAAKVFVEHYWIVNWDLRAGGPRVQEDLPHPSVHLVFEPGGASIYGVMRGKFSRQLADRGQVVGVKFRPGAFYPLLGAPVSSITDRVLPASQVFGAAVDELQACILELSDDAHMVALVEQFLRGRLPAPDPVAIGVARLVSRLVSEPRDLRVDELADRLGTSPRALQRLFSRYVGVSPKWVIKRARLFEAADRLGSPTAHDWSRLAQELGYFDQSHFIHDFKSVIGHTPDAYARPVDR
jgi:AraC-like DNA-binding protein